MAWSDAARQAARAAEASKRGEASDQDAAKALAGGGAKSAPPTLHQGTLPTPQSGCKIIYDSGQFIRVDPNSGGACAAT